MAHNFLDTTSYSKISNFQIHKDNKTETEEQIREALKSLMKPEEVEDELRKAIEGLNLEDSSATWKNDYLMPDILIWINIE